MDAQYQEAAAIESSLDYKDRSFGLIAFGVLTILMGCVCAMLVPLMLLGAVMSARAGAPGGVSLIPGILMYGLMAVALVWLGIGSIKVRRWARALLLIFSWGWLLTGIFMLVVMVAFVIPSIMASIPTNPVGRSTMPTTIRMIATGVFSFFCVVLPALFLFFYGSRNVKATCEARNPEACWTDACPLPVLAASLWLIFSALMFVVTAFSGHVVVPFFTDFLTGVPGVVACLALAVSWGYCGWAMYKFRPSAWWVTLVVLCGYGVSNILTFARHDVMEMYRLQGFKNVQIPSNFLSGSGMMWMVMSFMLLWLAFHIYLKKFFPK